MKHNFELLDQWAQYGNCLVGEIYNSRIHPNKTVVITEVLRFFDPINMEAEDIDTKYKLGVPCELSRYESLLRPKAKSYFDGDIKIDTGVFLRPNG